MTLKRWRTNHEGFDRLYHSLSHLERTCSLLFPMLMPLNIINSFHFFIFIQFSSILSSFSLYSLIWIMIIILTSTMVLLVHLSVTKLDMRTHQVIHVCKCCFFFFFSVDVFLLFCRCFSSLPLSLEAATRCILHKCISLPIFILFVRRHRGNVTTLPPSIFIISSRHHNDMRAKQKSIVFANLSALDVFWKAS